MTRLSPARPLRRKTATAAVFAAALTLIAAGCGSDKKSTSTTAAAGVAATTTAAPAGATTTAGAGATTTAASGGGGAATAVTAAESEFKIELGTTTFKPGATTFTVTNNGSFKHNLTIDGPGVSDEKTDSIDPGKTGTITATLAAGTYEIYCSIPTHKDKGMDVKITVA
jgi:uncharacterized cupredoxin-like copper-binding protein